MRRLCAAARVTHGAGPAGRQSTRVRPVSRKNTSSRLLAADECALGLDASVVHFLEGDLAVVGVDQDPVGRTSVRSPTPATLPARPSLVPAGKRSSSTSRVE